MIARGKHIDPHEEQLIGNISGNAESSGRVLAVGDDQVRTVQIHEPAKLGPHHFPARLADDIADEKNLH